MNACKNEFGTEIREAAHGSLLGSFRGFELGQKTYTGRPYIFAGMRVEEKDMETLCSLDLNLNKRQNRVHQQGYKAF